MNDIKCSECYKSIKANEQIFGKNGKFVCEKCYKKPLSRNQLFSKNVHDFYKQRKNWNDIAKKSNVNILNSKNYN